MVLAFQELYRSIKVVEILVTKQLIIDHIPLAAGMLEGVAVTLSREIEPLKENYGLESHTCILILLIYLWVTELIAFEVKVALSTQRVHDKTGIMSSV